MEIEKTNLEGCLVLKPKVFQDKRGYFFESFNQRTFNDVTGLNINFIQDNESFSTKGVLRGLHFQTGDKAQAKLVRVIKGEILDIVVDIRPGSKTYGKYFAIELTESNKKQLFVPRGFAHGYIVLSDTAIFAYKCDNYYDKGSEGGIIFNDPDLNIDWKLDEADFIVSEKDLVLPKLQDLNI
ncbi:dTDP-4-dehydrorhamnose 3,5-epimerase [Winogradskyella aurantia]|uniref:dTDP-4-dehydrorhamnose 3,5-epimerase n=1 Tax=Winogradskyella aurantia TaxID=1915063 RepID=A0A265V0K5_9FLAO|nr:dTDP-4-dehydrorhamnose 3,5-epimerase [Winogradskyella aurantia]OZV70827.1 dTDP-4-dehydrorhamnose 3,5-epimerase [Winogradskyella aurantia]